MSDVAISVEGLGKKYRIGNAPSEPYGSLRDSMMRSVKAPIDRLRRGRGAAETREHWALKEVSFEVKHGEAVGIIGRNGAGKSTLLKVLSRITEPTTGRAVVHGRVGSLLEVGTGFHPELTGRENIYLNGAVMGMSRADIKKHFGEIVDFAGVEKYLDTPVKRYSSGMYMRLAFAVAAHLEPEVLVVDEVLAVGDAEFQKKCLGKMGSVAREGRTVLFVSHNMSAIKHLCNCGVLLNAGAVTLVDSVGAAIEAYLQGQAVDRAIVDLTGFDNQHGHQELEVQSIELVNSVDNSFSVSWDEPFQIKITVKINEPLRNVSCAIACSTVEGLDVFTVRTIDCGDGLDLSAGQSIELSATIPHNLRAGRYNLRLGLESGTYVYYYNPFVAEMKVLDVGTDDYLYNNNGIINCSASWSIKYKTWR